MVVDTLDALIVFGGTYLAKLDRCGHPAVRSYLLLRGRFNRMARWLRRNSQEGNPSHAHCWSRKSMRTGAESATELSVDRTRLAYE